MTDTLNNKPIIGAISGLGSGILYGLKTLLTSDDILKWIAGAGIWLGLIVAFMTAYLRMQEIIKRHRDNNNQKT